MFDIAPEPIAHPIQQSECFARALATSDLPFLRLRDGTLVLRRKILGLQMRMLARPDLRGSAEWQAVLSSLPGRGPVILSLDTPVDLSAIGAIPLVSPQCVAELDLRPDLDELLAGQNQKWRNRLRHAQKQKLRTTRQNLPDDPDHWLFRADADQQRQRGYRTWPTILTLAYAQANRGCAKIFTAYWDRVPVAAILILRHGSAATYHIGHTRPAGMVCSAHNLLIWQAICWARSKGIARLDLGTVDTEDHPGLARFKLGTGAQARPLGGTWLWWPPLTNLLRPVARLDRRLMRLD